MSDARPTQHSEEPVVPLPDDEHRIVLLHSSGEVQKLSSLTNVAVLPGSFNPVHNGHRRLRSVAERMLGVSVVFEISVTNADKPELTNWQLRNRLISLRGEVVALTRAPLFAQKSALFPGCSFVVGFDTARRILDPRFYGNEPGGMISALSALAAGGHRFLVAGRLREGTPADRFETIEDLPVPSDLARLFHGIPEHDFRVDISSTMLRNREPQ
ncbi:MAG: hypothetical protein R3C19_17540 [Planctomycetaceae bacterium]